MPKTVIHVGLHKTGTTFLQSHIFSQAQRSRLISRPYTQHNWSWNRLQYADDTFFDEREFENEVNQFGSGGLIISDESLSGKPIGFGYVNRSMIARRLATFFGGSEIILFLRDQKDILVSQYSSYIRMPYGVKRFTDFLQYPKRDFSFFEYSGNKTRFDSSTLYFDTNDFKVQIECFKYSSLVALYHDLFSKVHVFLYEDLLARPEEVIARLSDICEEDFKPVDISENKALSPRGLVRDRAANRLAAGRGRLVRGALRKAAHLMPVIFTEDLERICRDRIGDFYSADNDVLKSMLPELNWASHPGKYV